MFWDHDTYLSLFGVVSIGVARLDHPDGLLVQLVEVIRGVRHSVAVHLQEGQILEDSLLELSL